MAATVELRDGRTLGYDAWGPDDGHPVFGFLGTPQTRLAHLGSEAPAAAGVRLFLVDRPGYGVSRFQPGRRLLDWPDDVAQFADALGIERFAVFGMSGGGPHAAACAYALANRVSALGLVSSPAPVADRPVLRYSLPLNRQPLVELVAADRDAAAKWLVEDCRRRLEEAAQDGGGDGSVDPELRERLLAATLDSTPEGYAHDLLLLFVSPWGFAPEEIGVPTSIWHGDRDPAVPFAVAEFFARTIPNSSLTVVPGGGHLILWSHAEKILAALR